jgi:hypothetical protein
MRLLFVLLLSSLSLHSQNTIESISYADYLNIDNSNDFIVIDVRTPEEHNIKRIRIQLTSIFMMKNSLIFSRFTIRMKIY